MPTGSFCAGEGVGLCARLEHLSQCCCARCFPWARPQGLVLVSKLRGVPAVSSHAHECDTLCPSRLFLSCLEPSAGAASFAPPQALSSAFPQGQLASVETPHCGVEQALMLAAFSEDALHLKTKKREGASGGGE